MRLVEKGCSMKLISCYVSSFGRLKDFSYNFDSGLNTIKQDNGWGKTTLATFIKAMFYGLDSAKRNVADNERTKYRPWNSTQKFGGYIEFEWGKNQYRIERYFGLKEAEDTIKLFDAKTGKEYSNTENLGDRIFEIDKEGFLSTTYFAQKDFQIKSNSSLTAKFNSVCEIQDTKTFDKALLKLEEGAKKYKYRGEKGLIFDVEHEIFDITEEIDRAQRSVQTVDLIKREVIDLQNEIDGLNGRIKDLTQKVAEVGEVEALKVKKEHYEQLIYERKELILQLEEVQTIINGNNVSAQEINDYLVCGKDLITIESNIKILDSDVSKIKSNLEGKQKQANKGNISLIMYFSSIILAISGATCLVFNVIVGIVLMALALGSLIIGLTSNKANKVEDNGYAQMLVEKTNELNKFNSLKQEILARVDSFISKFNLPINLDRSDALNKIVSIIEEQANLNKELDALDNKIKQYDSVKNSFDTLLQNNASVDDLKRELLSLQDEYQRKSNVLASKKNSLIVNENISSTIIDLENKKAQLISKKQEYVEDYELLTKTLKFLKIADENLKVKYRQPLQTSLNKYLSQIDDGKMKAQIDIDLNVSIQESDGIKVADYYSKGYQNLIEICKRFALTDVLFRGEKPFIVLDDPFYNLDDEKLKNALALIKKLSDEYQIIYFICHESRREQNGI